MQRTNIYLDERQVEALDRLAQTEGVSRAEVIRRLLDRGAIVSAYDPSGPDPTDSRLVGIDVVSDPYAAVADAEVLAILTEWDEFKWLDFDKVAEVMAAKRVVDARNLVDRAGLRRRGFSYEGIGRS